MIRDWLRNLRKHLLYTTAVLLAVAGSARAQNPDDLKGRLEAQEREIQELKTMIRAGAIQPAAAADAKLDDAAVKKLVDGYMADKDKAKKAEETAAKKKLEDEGFEVGADRKMTAKWDGVRGFVAETANKDFTFHVGGRFQQDTVFFTQTPALKTPTRNGNGATTVGDYQDGTFFRRMRIQMDGTAWQVFEFNLEFALEQVKEGIVQDDELFVGLKEIPFIGSVRAGHMRVPQGFEGDMQSSSKAMTFLERSLYTDAFYQNFAPGIWTGNSVLDQHMTWEAMAYRQENQFHNNDGANFGDGQYGYTGRMSLLPIYENDGLHLLHLAASGTWRDAEKPDAAAGQGGLTGPRQVRFRARQQMRDSIGDYGTLGLPGNANRIVDTGNLNAQATEVLGTELFYVCGPLSVQAEYAFARVSNASLPGAANGTFRGTPATRGFNGGYVEVSYFLTGEHRTYDRRLGRLGSDYLAGPATNFWLTRAEDGSLSLGRGAWEVAARFNYLNLNDGPVNGGVTDGLEFGLNWYLNPNVKINFEYFTDNRWSMGAGVPSGVVQGFGTRVQIGF